jgi:3-deoxy-D-manno-octulosonate 8-phosphate phosphatase (KDO 8-P phosphatase)
VTAARIGAGDVRLVAFDSDGTLTDRGIGWDTAGRGFRRFDVRDGIAMQWAQKAGLPVVVISGKVSRALDHRLAELSVPGFQGILDKVSCLAAFARAQGVTLEQCAFLGDDLPDVPALMAVGYPMAVADAHEVVRGLAAWTSPSAGGFGAARDALEHVLKACGLWAGVLAHYGAQDLADSAGAARRFE